MITDLRALRVPVDAAHKLGAALFIVAAAVLCSTCNSVPLTAPTNATITLYANTTIVPLNGTAQITATIIQNGGTVVHNGTEVTFSTSLGTIDPVTAETDDGKVTVTFHAGTQSGTATVNAYSGAVSTSGSSSSSGTTGTTTTTSGSALTLMVGAAAAGSVVLTASPSTIGGTGGTSTITATVLDTNSNGLASVPVTFSTDKGTVSPVTSTTNSSGQAITTLTTYETTTVTATAASKITGTVTITASAAPTVSLTTSSTSPTAKTSTTFSATITAGGSAIRSARIDFGDGDTQNLGAATGTVSIPHVYGDSGTYTVTLSATDVSGQTTTTSLPVTVFAAVPFTITVTASSGQTGQAITMTATPESGAPSITSYKWDFGDGETTTTTAGTVSHIYTTSDIPTGYTSWPFVITVTATGSDGRTGVGSTSVTVTKVGS